MHILHDQFGRQVPHRKTGASHPCRDAQNPMLGEDITSSNEYSTLIITERDFLKFSAVDVLISRIVFKVH